MIQTVKQLKNEVDAVSCLSIHIPQVEPSCQPCEGSATEIPPSTTSVTTERPTTVGLEEPRHHFQLDAKEQEWLELFHQRPKIEETSKMVEWMDKVVASSEGHRATTREPPVPVLEAPLDRAVFVENPQQSSEEHKAMLRVPPAHILEAPLDAVCSGESPQTADERVTGTLLSMLSVPTVDGGLHLVTPSIYASPSPALSFFEMDLDNLATTLDPVEATIMQTMQNDAEAASEIAEFAAVTDGVDISKVFDKDPLIIRERLPLGHLQGHLHPRIPLTPECIARSHTTD